MVSYEQPTILASYSIAELTADAALCMGYRGVPEVSKAMISKPPSSGRRS